MYENGKMTYALAKDEDDHIVCGTISCEDALLQSVYIMLSCEPSERYVTGDGFGVRRRDLTNMHPAYACSELTRRVSEAAGSLYGVCASRSGCRDVGEGRLELQVRISMPRQAAEAE